MIYADNAATTRISDSVLEKMLPFLREQYGNASSQYTLGAKSKRAIEQARKQVADAICAEAAEVTFTSGGSEAKCQFDASGGGAVACDGQTDCRRNKGKYTLRYGEWK